MSHKEQIDFVIAVKEKHPSFFVNKRVLEVGSLNINGTVRDLFVDCDYVGCDLGEGSGVDIVCAGQDSLHNMVRMLKPSGLLFFTCATTGRAEHGTSRTTPKDAPFCGDYYKNLVAEDFDTTGLNGEFSTLNTDLRFYGFKDK
jgi:hypothetical protein